MADGNGSTPPPPGNGDGKKPAGPNVKMSRNVVSWLLLLGVAMVLVALLQQNMTAAREINLTEFWTLVRNKQIERVTLKEDGMVEGRRKVTEGEPVNSPVDFKVLFPREAIDGKFVQQLIDALPDAEVKAEKPSQFMMVLASLLPWILIFAFIWFVIFRQIRGAGGPGGMLGSFGRSRHRLTHKEHTNITFSDVAGIDEAKDEVREIIEFLKAPKKFQRLGARIPRGILLVGSPGCGKTLLAKAIAGEADVPFFSISGSDFVEMFVGVGASRVRDLFKQAKENSPCIIFLDEIDAVGRKRGANFGGGGHDEREQTLNAILVEMDGFDTNSQVIVIAATNRADVLDPALIRPGRFDRQVYVSLPDVQGRYEILKVHMKKVKLGPTVDVRRCARGTPMFSGAELAAMVNEAAIVATLQNKEFVEQDDLEEARDKIRWGRAKKSRVMDEKETRATAYHEAGHALVQALLPDADPLHKVSIIPRGPYAGMTAALPEKDRITYSLKYLRATMRVLCGGRIAEQLSCGDVNTGAMADIRQITEMARKMVTEWGMTEKLGFISYADDEHRTAWGDLPGGRDYSDVTARTIDEELRKLVDEAYEDARRMIMENRDRLEAIAVALLKCETLTGEEVHALIRGESVERASVADLLDRVAADDRVSVARPVRADASPRPEIGGGPLPQPG